MLSWNQEPQLEPLGVKSWHGMCIVRRREGQELIFLLYFAILMANSSTINLVSHAVSLYLLTLMAETRDRFNPKQQIETLTKN
jgi:hypothetical protein